MSLRQVTIGDAMYRLDSDDDYLQSIGDTFEPQLTRLFRILVRRQDTVIDVGANIGCTSTLFAALSHRVYAFEPSPSTHAFLVANLARSGFSNVETFNVALGAAAGSIRLICAEQPFRCLLGSVASAKRRSCD